ncbi:MAG TPA: hypothetical protein PLD73_03930 [Candidatus Hydrogenedentes bacterium]|jgi:uncharacterized protein YceK|nr:hypothetical protein [Candidatus Hydrogenedentota bacterium]
MKKLILFVVLCGVVLGTFGCGSKGTSTSGKERETINYGTQADRADRRGN